MLLELFNYKYFGFVTRNFLPLLNDYDSYNNLNRVKSDQVHMLSLDCALWFRLYAACIH